MGISYGDPEGRKANPRPLKERPHALLIDPKEGRTKQAHKDECDLNLIVQRYVQNNVPLPEAPPPVFMDTTAFDYQSQADMIANVNSQFAEVPAAVRAHFGHKVDEFMDWLAESDTQELIAERGYHKAVLSVVQRDIEDEPPPPPRVDRDRPVEEPSGDDDGE